MYGRPAGKSSRSLATCGAAGTRRCGRTERAGGRAADRPPQRAANRGPRRRDGAGEPRRREWTDGTARGRDRQQAGAAAATGSCSPSHDSGWTGGCCCCYVAPAVGRRRWTGAKAADLPGGRLDEDDAAAAVPRGSSGDDWAPSICGRESQIEARRHSICARDDESRPGGGRRSRTDGCDLRTNGGCCCCCDSTGKENGFGA